MSNFNISPSKIHGQGIHAAHAFQQDDQIGCLVTIVQKKEANKEYFTTGASRYFGTFVERTDLEKFINHSETPNTKCLVDNDKVYLVANQAIAVNEEITVNYVESDRAFTKSERLVRCSPKK